MAQADENTVVLVVGNGSHASVVEDIISARDASASVVRVDWSEGCDIPEAERAVCAIGDNWLRRRAVRDISLRRPSLQWVAAVHPTATVAKSCVVGDGSVVCARAVLQPGCKLSPHAIVNTRASVDHHCEVGAFAHVAPGCTLCGNVKVQEGALLGAGSVATPKTTVQAWSLVRTGSAVTSPTPPTIPVYDVELPAACEEYASEAVRSGWLSAQGRYVERAQNMISERMRVRHAMLTCNGTVAVHCCMLALKRFYPHVTEVYVPDNVYVAAWNATAMVFGAGALRVLPTDEHTWNVSLEAVRALPEGAAVLVVHNLGTVVNVPAILRDRPDLVIVEDNCEGMFGEYEGAATGSACFASAASFYGNKILTCGEGGVVCTNRDDVADFVKRMCTQGMTGTRFVHDLLAYNYRITNLQAAVLCAQLEGLDELLVKKRGLFSAYDRVVSRERGVLRPVTDQNTVSAPWMYAVRVVGGNYADIAARTGRRFVECRPMFYPVEAHAHLSDAKRVGGESRKRAIACATALAREIVVLPSGPTLTKSQQLCSMRNVIAVSHKSAV